MIEQQFEVLSNECLRKHHAQASRLALPNGSQLISIADFPLALGWNQQKVTVHFVAPPGYPAAKPDCFWVEPAGLRLADGGTPQNSNDANPIPGDTQPGRRTTWFSWHLQGWDPNQDSLLTFFEVIRQRLSPAR
ncbi:E2/UBC family protein [Rhodanobacter sp. DHG33]|uniref:E2/UBC family protein n=1 Tax=Rhodanobacter sp. DHG33 TaxID=2775921 RepID=UPI00177CEF42|nr:E2/UBC family protein [Rhodanobacter sp. DHG33]MBD8900359.1 hypothetical protein [Rhodanobacter sp. DHG33]